VTDHDALRLHTRARSAACRRGRDRIVPPASAVARDIERATAHSLAGRSRPADDGGGKAGAQTRFKRAVWTSGDRLGAFGIGQMLRHLRHRGRYIRAVIYHATPASLADNLRRHLDFYRRHFDNATPDDLSRCLAGQRDPASRPGLIITFDDGYADNYEVAAPLLEEYGFTGWFFVSSGRVGDRDVSRPDGKAAPDDGPFMTFDEMKDLRARGHVVGCHTHSHSRLADALGPARLVEEIAHSHRRLEQALDFPVDVFCWVGGEEWSYSIEAARLVAARYRYAFTTLNHVLTARTPPLMLSRTNVDASWPLARVRFYLSGATDLVHMPKRRRVFEKLAYGSALGQTPQGSTPRV